ncbi:MAG: hypothetical protein ABJO09_00070 [Hyphomicrobiales bacterium]|uniref:hypothetical protein n=1 Tax=Roseobacteraceae TaxID=2854170 RepID=UPI00326BCECB
MVRSKTDSERRYEAAQVELAAAEKAVSAAERITASHPSKIETKRRQLADLNNTMHYAESDQNSRANRAEKKARLESDKAQLERELNEAQTTLAEARDAAQTARNHASQSAASFTVERDRAVMDAEAQKAELAMQSHDLAERKFAQAEKDKMEAAKTQLAKAEADGKTTLEVERYRAKATAATLQFEWQQRRELEEYTAQNRANEIAVSNGHEIELAQIHGTIAREQSELSHGQALEIIKANEISDIGRIIANGKEHRLNVTHETNEDIRKAMEIMALTTQKSITDTLNAAKLLVLKHYLRKDEMSHALEIGQDARAEELDSVAADMAEIARWQANREKSKPDFEEPNN